MLEKLVHRVVSQECDCISSCRKFKKVDAAGECWIRLCQTRRIVRAGSGGMTVMGVISLPGESTMDCGRMEMPGPSATRVRIVPTSPLS